MFAEKQGRQLMLPFGYEPCTGSLSMSLWWSSCPLYLHTCQVRVIVGDAGLCRCFEDVSMVEFMYLVFTHMPGELP